MFFNFDWYEISIKYITGLRLWQNLYKIKETHEENADEIRDPASMSKAMTLYLVFEAMSKGEISEETVITTTPTDQAIADIYEISNNKIVAGNVEKDIYATVKKGQELKISVKDDQIVIDNGLKTVSPNIKPTSVKATKAGFFLFSFG